MDNIIDQLKTVSYLSLDEATLRRSVELVLELCSMIAKDGNNYQSSIASLSSMNTGTLSRIIRYGEENRMISMYRKQGTGFKLFIVPYDGTVHDKSSSEGERQLYSILRCNSLQYVTKYTVYHSTGSGRAKKLIFDACVINERGDTILIEVQGIQHSRRVEFFHATEEAYAKACQRDMMKREYTTVRNMLTPTYLYCIDYANGHLSYSADSILAYIRSPHYE